MLNIYFKSESFYFYKLLKMRDNEENESLEVSHIRELFASRRKNFPNWENMPKTN